MNLGYQPYGENEPELARAWQRGFHSVINESNPYGNPDIPGPDGITPEYDAWLEGYWYLWRNLSRAVAKIIYHHEGGMCDEDFFNLTDEERTPWEELDQHRHDEYYSPADAILTSLFEAGFLNIDAIRAECMKQPPVKESYVERS